jgi:hypothetical protein
MTMRIPTRAEARFRQRWEDYCYVLESGTPPEVGSRVPPPPDAKEVIGSGLAGGGVSPWDAGNAELDRIWREDQLLWRHRLGRPFLQNLDGVAQNAFGKLVALGCQADMLALRFHKAVAVNELAKSEKWMKLEISELSELTDRALDSLTKLARRRSQFDERSAVRRLRVVSGEPGEAELKIFLLDFQELAERHRHEYRSLARQLDGRREQLLGHAEVALSRHVRSCTGRFHDSLVEGVLNEMRARAGLPERGPGSLKRRRARVQERWSKPDVD